MRTMTSRKVTMTATMLELGSSDCQIVTLSFSAFERLSFSSLRLLFSLYPPDILCSFSALSFIVSDWSSLTKSDLVFNPPENCPVLGRMCALSRRSYNLESGGSSLHGGCPPLPPQQIFLKNYLAKFAIHKLTKIWLATRPHTPHKFAPYF